MKRATSGPDRKWRVALIGGGKMASHHIRALRLLGDSTIVGVADPAVDPEALRGVAGEDVPVFRDGEGLFDAVTADIVHVCTPPQSHVRWAEEALRRGAHVYVEKPFALAAADATRVVSLAESSGLAVCAGHQLLFEPPTLKARECLRKIGKVVHVESHFSFRPVRRSQDGRAPIAPLDQLADILPHPVYLLLHFLESGDGGPEGSPAEIRGLDVSTRGMASAIVRRGSVSGTLFVTLEGRPVESYVKITGTNGSILADYVRGTVVLLAGPGASGVSKVLNPYIRSWQDVLGTTGALARRFVRGQTSYPGLAEIFKAFHDGIAQGSPSATPGRSILETVALCEEVVMNLRALAVREAAVAEESLRIAETAISAPDPSVPSVLVTGGTGFLGKAVVRELRKRNRLVRVLARRVPPHEERIPGVEYVACDLAATVNPGLLRGIAVVVHCVAETAGGTEAHARNSIGAVRNLLLAMAEAEVRKLVHVSSLAVLTRRRGAVPADEKTLLDDRAEERGPYVWGKAESERLAADLCRRHGIGLRVVRPGPLVDYDVFEAPGRLGKEVGPLFVLVGSRRSRLSLCPVGTAADVIRLYADDFDSMPPVLNLVEPDPPTRGELVDRLREARPDLKVIRLPAILLRIASPGLVLLQRLAFSGRKPVDIHAAFASERYDAKLAAWIIGRARAAREEARTTAP